MKPCPTCHAPATWTLATLATDHATRRRYVSDCCFAEQPLAMVKDHASPKSGVRSARERLRVLDKCDWAASGLF